MIFPFQQSIIQSKLAKACVVEYRVNFSSKHNDGKHKSSITFYHKHKQNTSVNLLEIAARRSGESSEGAHGARRLENHEGGVNLSEEVKSRTHPGGMRSRSDTRNDGITGNLQKMPLNHGASVPLYYSQDKTAKAVEQIFRKRFLSPRSEHCEPLLDSVSPGQSIINIGIRISCHALRHPAYFLTYPQ